MQPRFRSSFAAPTGFVAAVTRMKPRTATVLRVPAPRVSASAAAATEAETQRAA